LDHEGQPHIGFVWVNDFWGLNLLYAHFDGSEWTIETLTAEESYPTCVSIDVDNRGEPHLSYLEGAGGSYDPTLKYTHREGSVWITETVDETSTEGTSEGTSIAIDSSGRPHISYHDSENSSLKYARRDFSGWHVENVDEDGSVGTGSSITLDSNDVPHISYYVSHNNDVKYAKKEGPTWEITTIDTTCMSNDRLHPTSIALDAAGNPHISYSEKGALGYAYFDGSDWFQEIVVKGNTGYRIGHYSSIAIDPLGRPCLAFNYSTGTEYTGYARRKSLP
jgi:hypothetical protein